MCIRDRPCGGETTNDFFKKARSVSLPLIFMPITDGLGIIIMATYETFAAVYDAVMDDSLYDLWTDFSLRHLPKTKDKKKLLELRWICPVRPHSAYRWGVGSPDQTRSWR